jgi:hypothetical protein
METESELSPEIAALVHAHLAPGERVVWRGRPITWRFTWQRLPLGLFGLVMMGWALWRAGGPSGLSWPDTSQDFVHWLFDAAIFAAGALFLLVTPFALTLRAMRIAYVITEQRVLVVEGPPGRWAKVMSFEPDLITNFRCTRYRDGSGNLVFAKVTGQYIPGHGNAFPINAGFYAVARVDEVEDHVRRLIRQSQSRDA